MSSPVSKPLIAPRFLSHDDSATVAAIVRNDLDRPLETLVRMSAENATLVGNERKIVLEPGRQHRLEWTVRADSLGEVALRGEALSEMESDAVERTVPVHAGGYGGAVVHAGRVDKQWEATLELPEDAIPETARLNLVVGSVGVSTIVEALPFLSQCPYGCVEQTMSRFLPALIADRAIERFKLKDRQSRDTTYGGTFIHATNLRSSTIPNSGDFGYAGKFVSFLPTARCPLPTDLSPDFENLHSSGLRGCLSWSPR